MKTVKDVVNHKHPRKRKIVAMAPDLCDHCHGTLRTGASFYDAHTKFGPWAWLCEVCYADVGPPGLGTGIGQQYNSETNEKEAG